MLKRCTSGEPLVNVAVNVVLPLVNVVNVVSIHIPILLKRIVYNDIHYVHQIDEKKVGRGPHFAATFTRFTNRGTTFTRTFTFGTSQRSPFAKIGGFL